LVGRQDHILLGMAVALVLGDPVLAAVGEFLDALFLCLGWLDVVRRTMGCRNT
jgi:hypothetical protein